MVKVDGVESAQADATAGIATVKYDPAKTDPEKIAREFSAASRFEARVQ